MNEIDHLISISQPNIRRSTRLIIPGVTPLNKTWSLNNSHWAYRVPYEFREALDIDYTKRVKNKQPSMVWTQGPVINFTEGDLLSSKDDKTHLQVLFSNGCGWDPSKNIFYLGSITYDQYEPSSKGFVKKARHSCNQFQFLELLIYGAAPHG